MVKRVLVSIQTKIFISMTSSTGMDTLKKEKSAGTNIYSTQGMYCGHASVTHT